eukprot:CAMPEP_0170488884 /NCGR_PEP_ID=MMETSP0208-20121228/7325_1 /TAXON_ID=197538 /ORGANISM="Strombidium inclinatum, Strain S3" /LENGTH=458 /DNA_ID=CAMNT_0010763589 /DNA_START=673 /DNA_END=2051 /DNA_ORIENTATION=-
MLKWDSDSNEVPCFKPLWKASGWIPHVSFFSRNPKLEARSLMGGKTLGLPTLMDFLSSMSLTELWASMNSCQGHRSGSELLQPLVALVELAAFLELLVFFLLLLTNFLESEVVDLAQPQGLTLPYIIAVALLAEQLDALDLVVDVGQRVLVNLQHHVDLALIVHVDLAIQRRGLAREHALHLGGCVLLLGLLAEHLGEVERGVGVFLDASAHHRGDLADVGGAHVGDRVVRNQVFGAVVTALDHLRVHLAFVSARSEGELRAFPTRLDRAPHLVVDFTLQHIVDDLLLLDLTQKVLPFSVGVGLAVFEQFDLSLEGVLLVLQLLAIGVLVLALLLQLMVSAHDFHHDALDLGDLCLDQPEVCLNFILIIVFAVALLLQHVEGYRFHGILGGVKLLRLDKAQDILESVLEVGPFQALLPAESGKDLVAALDEVVLLLLVEELLLPILLGVVALAATWHE